MQLSDLVSRARRMIGLGFLVVLTSQVHAADQDPTTALIDQGVTEYRAGNHAAAVEILQPIAEQGNARAQLMMGVATLSGSGVAQDDAGAFAWFMAAAEQDHPGAQYQVGWLMERGRGVPMDEPQAADWFRRAAENGNARAQHDLGMMLASGRAGVRDPAEAARWYRSAAESGLADAQHSLALLLWDGMPPVAADRVESARLWRLACAQGHALSGRELTNRGLGLVDINTPGPANC